MLNTRVLIRCVVQKSNTNDVMQVAATDDRIRHNGRVKPCKKNNDENDAVVVQRGSHNLNSDVRTTHHGNTTTSSFTEISTQEGTTPTLRQNLIVDNTQNIYIPIRLPCGITVMYQQDIFEQPQSFKQQIQMILETDVSYCLQILPVSVRALIKRTKIWVNRNNYYYNDPQQQQQQNRQPIYVNHTTTHHHVAWLLWYVCLSSYIVYYIHTLEILL